MNTDSAIRTDRGSVGLVVGSFKNKWDRFRAANLRDTPRHSPNEFFRFNHARAENKGRLHTANGNGSNFYRLEFHGSKRSGRNDTSTTATGLQGDVSGFQYLPLCSSVSFVREILCFEKIINRERQIEQQIKEKR